MSTAPLAQLASQSAAPAPSFETVAQQAAQLGRRLNARGWMVSTVESCTGGLIAAALTDVAGSSAWFERGFVTYSNEAKTGAVRVPADLIVAHGAVSEAVAAAMARGALLASRARIAVSVTGVAGPSGGSVEKPVGTVCFGWAYWPDAEPDSDGHASSAGMAQTRETADRREDAREEKPAASRGEPMVHTVTCHFDGDRRAVRLRSVRHALQGLDTLLPAGN